MTLFSLVLLLLLAVAVAVIVGLLRRRPAQAMPPAPSPSPYARDDAFGRPDPAWGAGYPQQPGMPPAAGGLGASVAGGLAAGLAMGAGAVAAQEIGRRMFEHGHEGQAHAPEPSPAVPHDQSHSQIARDAGIGAFEHGPEPQGLQDFGDADADWGDAGGVDDGGSWET